jgi:hypothetical protein
MAEVTMAALAPKVPAISRTDAIALLRESLARIAGPDTSFCKAAADRGIFCRGFRRRDDAALRSEYSWIESRRPGISRDELEQLGDRWQLARQELHQLPTSCDVQAEEHDTCWGWDDFTSQQLAQFLLELTRRKVVVAES